MKIAAITFLKEDKSNQSILGFCEYDRLKDCPLVNNESCFKYQIRSDDDGKGEPATIETAVAINHYADFVTDTKIDFPHKDNASGGYATLSGDIEEMSDKSYSENSYSLKNELELFRKNLLSEVLLEQIKDAKYTDLGMIMNNISADLDGNLHLNFYGVPYTLEIHNDKEFE